MWIYCKKTDYVREAQKEVEMYEVLTNKVIVLEYQQLVCSTFTNINTEVS